MTVIAVVPVDPGRETQRWSVPSDNALNQSPIPRGLRLYGGSIAVAALGANDETNVAVSLTFPSAFIYLPKLLTITFLSDDLTTEFGDIGALEYRPGGLSTIGDRINFELFTDGAAFRGAVRSEQYYRPLGEWRRWVNGPNGDTVLMFIADVSGDTSTAGDVAWHAEFWEYDVEQCLKWPVNTPQPIVNY